MKLTKNTDINGRVTYEIEDARWIWTNFSGKEGRFNDEGRRNFNLVLTDDIADQLSKDGFNVKWHEPKDPNGEGIWTLKVNVNYKGFNPPKIELKNDHGIRSLDEESVPILDGSLMIENMFVRISPYRFNDSTSAYLQTMLIRIHESDYENSFYDEEDSVMNTTTFAKID